MARNGLLIRNGHYRDSWKGMKSNFNIEIMWYFPQKALEINMHAESVRKSVKALCVISMSNGWDVFGLCVFNISDSYELQNFISNLDFLLVNALRLGFNHWNHSMANIRHKNKFFNQLGKSNLAYMIITESGSLAEMRWMLSEYDRAIFARNWGISSCLHYIVHSLQ